MKWSFKRLFDTAVTAVLCLSLVYLLIVLLIPASHTWIEAVQAEGFSGWMLLLVIDGIWAIGVVVAVGISGELMYVVTQVCVTGNGILWVRVNQEQVLRFSRLHHGIESSPLQE